MKLQAKVPHDGRAVGDVYEQFNEQSILHALNNGHASRVADDTKITVKAKSPVAQKVLPVTPVEPATWTPQTVASIKKDKTRL